MVSSRTSCSPISPTSAPDAGALSGSADPGVTTAKAPGVAGAFTADPAESGDERFSSEDLDVRPGQPPDELSARIVLGAIECIGRWGWERTTIDDVANAARCSRASVYRKFGGTPKPFILDEVLAAVGADMVLAVDRELEASMGEPGLRHALTAAIVAAANEFENNRTVAELIRTDRKAILPLIAFDRLDPIVKRYSSHLVGLVEPHAGNRADAVAITSWATRMLLAYVFSPTAPKFVLTDPTAVDHLVITYLLPGFERR